MKKKLLILVLTFSVFSLHAIVVCHDYALYRVSGKDPRPLSLGIKSGIGVNTLRDSLLQRGYKMFPYSNAIQNPETAGKFLRPGDVLIYKDDHSGVVNNNKLIDHFLQVFGKSGTIYPCDSLPKNKDLGGTAGGLYENETLVDFLQRPFNKTGPRLEVWRKQ